MIDKSIKINILNKIISSKTFIELDKYKSLLTYLVEATLSENIPKEYSIAIDVFKRNQNFDPAHDTIVRYYMYRLRKKINEYYANEGQNDKIKLNIPRGHYAVKFRPHTKSSLNIFQKLKKKDLILSFIIVFLSILIALLLYKYLLITKTYRIIDNSIDQDDQIWSSFFKNQLPTTLLFGDHFLIGYDESEQYKEEVDFSINNMDDFNHYVKLHPERSIIKYDHGSLPHNSLCNLKEIVHVFYSFNQKLDIQFTSEHMSKSTDLIDLADRNTIYIGGFRNLRQLNQIIEKLPLEYEYTDIFKGEIRIYDVETDSLITFKSRKLEGNNFLDLGLIVKLPGPNNENYLFLIGFAYPAQIETVRMLSRQKSLQKLYNQTAEQYTIFPEYFYMVVEFISFEYTARETSIKYMREFTLD